MGPGVSSRASTCLCTGIKKIPSVVFGFDDTSCVGRIVHGGLGSVRMVCRAYYNERHPSHVAFWNSRFILVILGAWQNWDLSLVLPISSCCWPSGPWCLQVYLHPAASLSVPTAGFSWCAEGHGLRLAQRQLRRSVAIGYGQRHTFPCRALVLLAQNTSRAMAIHRGHSAQKVSSCKRRAFMRLQLQPARCCCIDMLFTRIFILLLVPG